MNKITLDQKKESKTKITIPSLLLLLLMMATQMSWGQATLPFYDGLNYTVGQSLPSQTAGGWVLSAAATTDMLITAGSLNYPGLPVSTGNKVAFSGGGEDAAKSFTAITQTASAKVYCSYILNIVDLPAGFTDGYFAAFGTASNTGTPGTGNQAIPTWVKPSTNAGFFKIGFSEKASKTAVYQSADYQVGVPVLIVICYEVISGTTKDLIKAWINPIPGAAQPTAAYELTSTADLADVSNFYIKQNSGTSTPSVEMDEIRVGSTWADVTPAAPAALVTPTLTADATDNNVDTNIDVTFTDDSAWRSAITAVKIGTTTLTSGTDYSITSGNIQFKPSSGNSLLTSSGSKAITVVATGYSDATLTQVINAGVPTAVNSTATIDASLVPNATRKITCTAKDQYSNPVSGYVFKYDVVITNNDVTTAESYLLDGIAKVASTNDVSILTTTNSSGMATFDIVLPAVIDGNDGISIQTQLNDGVTNIGSNFSFIQIAPQTINFGTLTPVTYGDAAFNLTATATSALAVSYVSSNTAVATVSGNTVTILGVGSTDIKASQAGNGSYNAAVDVVQTLTVNPKSLTIATAVAQNKVYNGNSDAVITGTISGIVNSDDVTFTGKGIFSDVNAANAIAVTSTSTLGGTKASNYILTQPTGLTADITPANQSITFAATSTRYEGFLDYLSDATSSTSGINGITYSSSNPNVATIVSNQIHYVGIGVTTITASQAASTNYNAAADKVQTLTVTKAPLAAWNFYTTASVSTPIKQAVIFNSNLVTSSSADFITRGAGAPASGGTSIFKTSGFSNDGISTTNTDYYQITIQANTGKKVSLSTIDAIFNSSGSFNDGVTGITSQFAYSLDGGTTLTLIGNPVTSTSLNLTQIDLSSVAALQNVPAGTTITLRYYASGNNTTGGWGFYSSTASSDKNGLTIGGTINELYPTWNGVAWSNITGPDATTEAVIAGNYSTTANGIFSAKKVTINSGSLTVNTGTKLTIQDEIINNAGAGGLVIENNANLIQVSNSVNTGNAVVKRNSSALSLLDHVIWSSPVSNQNLLAFTPTTATTEFYDYDAAVNSYKAISDPSVAVFKPGIGSLIGVPNTFPSAPATGIFNGEFNGVLNNGDIPVTLNYIASNQGYNLVGNPYASTIDAEAFLAANSGNIEGALYFWQKNSTGGSAYATYTAAGTTVASAVSTAPSGVIQVGEGFVVEAKSAANVPAFFTNAMRTANVTQPLKIKNVEDKNRIWVNLTNDKGAFSQMLVGYIKDATQGVDVFDGKYINDSPIALTSKINNQEYVIQGRALPFDGTDEISLNFKTDVAGQYTITIDHVDGLFAAGQGVYLVDNVTGKEINLQKNAYTFTATAGENSSRFTMKFQTTLKVNDFSAFNENNVIIYHNAGVIYVNSGQNIMSNLKIFDLQGRLIGEQKNINATATSVKDLNISKQVLIIQVTSEDNKVVNKKIIN